MYADLDSFTHGPGSEVYLYLYRYQYRWYRYKYIVGSYGSTSIFMFLLPSDKRMVDLNGGTTSRSFQHDLSGNVCLYLSAHYFCGANLSIVFSVPDITGKRESPDSECPLTLLRSRTGVTPLPSGWRTFQLGHSLTESFMLLHRRKF